MAAVRMLAVTGFVFCLNFFATYFALKHWHNNHVQSGAEITFADKKKKGV
jgi:hypothetical protein